MTIKKICVSCKNEIVGGENSVEFKCFNCKNTIIRCGTCRKSMIKYICPNCKQGGP